MSVCMCKYQSISISREVTQNENANIYLSPSFFKTSKFVPPINFSLIVRVLQRGRIFPGEVYIKFSHKDVAFATSARDAGEPVWNEVLKIVLPLDCLELMVELWTAEGPKGEGVHLANTESLATDEAQSTCLMFFYPSQGQSRPQTLRMSR